MAYNAELQMLREFAHFYLPRLLCYFCQKPLMEKQVETFGHRRHPKVRARITLHHIDEDRQHNDWINLSWAHSACHRRFHKQLLLAAGKETSNARQAVQQSGKEGDEEEKEGKVTHATPTN
jgi:hypothetical protein